MAKKKREKDKNNEPEEVVSVESNIEDADSTTETSHAVEPVEKKQDVASTESPDEAPEAENQDEVKEDFSADDLLEEVRHTLITDEEQKEEEKKSKWWNRLGRRGKKEEAEVPVPEPMSVSVPEEEKLIAVEGKDDEVQEEYIEEIDDLIELLEEEAEEVEGEKDVEAQPPVEKEPEVPVKPSVNFNELKKRAFSSRPKDEVEEESISNVRAVALDEGDDVFVEIETAKADPIEERWKALENALLPYRRYINFIAVFIGVVILLVAGFVLVSNYRAAVRANEPQEDAPLLPFPVGLNLPGDIYFSLGKGALDNNGKWNPNGPEWLEGTEVCRWVAIPYSAQMEAVVLTLKKDNVIELIMSNNDKLEYKVKSVTPLTITDMQKLDSGSPCLLVVLAEADTDERWVVTSVP